MQSRPSFQLDKKAANGKIRQHSWRRQQQQQDPNNNNISAVAAAAFKATQGQGRAFREIPMLNMFLQRLQQHTNLATAAAILGSPAAAAAAAAPHAGAMRQQTASPAKGLKGGKHKIGGKKQGCDSISLGNVLSGCAREIRENFWFQIQLGHLA